MPIQWNGTITSQQQLAGVIQGEAGGDPAAQFAVASTMWNRMSTPGPYVGGGSGSVASVVLPSQFNGYNASPNSNAMNLAGALMNGQPPPGGSTGNATFFAAPVAGNAAWAAPGGPLFNPTTGGTNIGGNYFTDQLGAPSSNFQPPQYNGSGTTIANGPADTSSGSTVASGSTDPLGSSVTMNPTGTATTTTPTTSSTSTGAAQGVPEQQALQPEAVSQIGSWITGIENSVGGAFSGAVKAAETAAGTYLGSVQNWFTRAGLIFLGVLIIVVALVVLMWDHGGKNVATTAVQVARA